MSTTHQAHGARGFVEDQREFFDQLITRDWDTYINARWDRTRSIEVREILRMVSEPKRVLDIGCGCGYHDVIFAQSPAVERVVGIDYSPESIAQADRHYPHAKVERRVADFVSDGALAERLGTFDLVVSFQVIEHLSKPQALLEACCRVAVRGGFVAVVTPNRASLQNRWRQLTGRQPLMVDPLHFAEYTIDELAGMGEQSGLQYVAHFGHTLHLTLRGRTILGGRTSVALGRRVPSWANVIGVVFRKPR